VTREAILDTTKARVLLAIYQLQRILQQDFR